MCQMGSMHVPVISTHLACCFCSGSITHGEQANEEREELCVPCCQCYATIGKVLYMMKAYKIHNFSTEHVVHNTT
jgi:hypothetical protein